MNYLQRKIAKSTHHTIEIRRGDWKAACIETAPDVILFQQFSAFLNDWQLLCRSAKRMIIAILPSSGDPYRGPVDQNRHSSAPLPVTAQKSMRETWETVSAFLKEKNVPHTVIPFEIDFGQPFRNKDEVFAYYRYYYGETLTDAELKETAEQRLQTTPDGFYLPKPKKLGIVIVPVCSDRSQG